MKKIFFKIFLGLVLFNHQNLAQGGDNGWPSQEESNNNQGGNNQQGGGPNNNQGGNNQQGGGPNNNQGGNNQQGGGPNNNQGGNNQQGGGLNKDKKPKGTSSQKGQPLNIVQGTDITTPALKGVSVFQTLSPPAPATPAPAGGGPVVPKSHIDKEDLAQRLAQEYERGLLEGLKLTTIKSRRAIRKDKKISFKNKKKRKSKRKKQKQCICIG